MPVIPFIPLLAAVAAPVVTKMMTKDVPAPAAPAIPAPVAMPTINDAAGSAARRRSLAEQISRKGRASSILSQTTSDASEAFG